MFELEGEHVGIKLGGKLVERTQADEFVAAKSADTKDDIVFIATIALRQRYDPTNERCAGSIAYDTRLSMELEEKVSSDSGTNGILLCLLLNGMLFCLQYHIVGAVTIRCLTQSQFLYPGRVKRGEGRDGRLHSVLSVAPVDDHDVCRKTIVTCHAPPPVTSQHSILC